jgi:cell division protein FtsW
VGFLLIIKVDINRYKGIVKIALISLLVILAGLLFYGTLVNSAKSWFKIGAFSFQPSEFAKLILVLYMGIFFADYVKEGTNQNKIWVFLTICGVIFLLVAAQPDLGTAIIIAGIAFLTFLSIPIKKNNLISILKVSAGAGVIIVSIFLMFSSSILTERQRSRFEFREPCSRYTKDTGYQVCNGFIAIHNGGLFGMGIGKSTQKYLYLPEAHTDFIFTILVEELGVLAGSLVLAGYAYLILRIIKISKECYNLRNSIICYGIAMMFLMHTVINFMGVLALMPLTGVPLPLLSYGGSFTLTSIASLFIVQRIAIENNLTKKKLEISKITGK